VENHTDQANWMSDLDFYILEGREVRKVGLHEWSLWLQGDPKTRSVGRDEFQSERYGKIIVSTVFLGVPTGGDGTMFESMIFREKGTDQDNMPPADDLLCFGFWGEMRRYKTYDEAEAGHKELVEQITDLGESGAWLKDEHVENS